MLITRLVWCARPTLLAKCRGIRSIYNPLNETAIRRSTNRRLGVRDIAYLGFGSPQSSTDGSTARASTAARWPASPARRAQRGARQRRPPPGWLPSSAIGRRAPPSAPHRAVPEQAADARTPLLTRTAPRPGPAPLGAIGPLIARNHISSLAFRLLRRDSLFCVPWIVRIHDVATCHRLDRDAPGVAAARGRF
jgi:hypothetical protein